MNTINLVLVIGALTLLVWIVDVWREYSEPPRRRYYVRLGVIWARVPYCLFKHARRGRFMTKYFRPWE